MEEKKTRSGKKDNIEKNGETTVSAKIITLKVIISLLGIAIGVLAVIFVCEMIGGVMGDGCAQVVDTLEDALNGDFDSYWSLLPEDYVKNQAADAGTYAIDYKTRMKSEYKKYSSALSKTNRSYTLEASKQKKLSQDELAALNDKLVNDDKIPVRCTEAFSITLTVNVTVGQDTHSSDRNDFLIGKIDGEWYPLDFAFVEIK